VPFRRPDVLGRQGMSLGDLHINWDHPHVLPIFASFLFVIFSFLALVLFAFTAMQAMLVGNHSAVDSLPYLYFFFGCVIAALVILIASITSKEKPKPRAVYRSFENQNGKAAETTPKASGILSNSKLLKVVITTVGLIVVALIQFPPWQHRGTQPVPLVFAGSVLDKHTQDVIGLAEVTLKGLGQLYTATTERDGSFTIQVAVNDEPARAFRIQVSKEGYENYDGPVQPGPNLVIQLIKR
jgi:hypothetical protein